MEPKPNFYVRHDGFLREVDHVQVINGKEFYSLVANVSPDVGAVSGGELIPGAGLVRYDRKGKALGCPPISADINREGAEDWAFTHLGPTSLDEYKGEKTIHKINLAGSKEPGKPSAELHPRELYSGGGSWADALLAAWEQLYRG